MSWQNEPATEKQVASYNRMCEQLGIPGLIGTMTKGEIGPMIGALKKEVAKLPPAETPDITLPETY